MSRFFLGCGAACLLAVIVTWVALGADRGWSKTLVPVAKIDPVTELEFTDYEKRFVPGLDFLVAGSAGSLFLVATGLMLAKFPRS
jgi:hypothetical protein